MAISIVRLGSPRGAEEGPRIGTVRFPPRGVAKTDLARLNFYDVWFPNLAPSAALLKEARAANDDRSWDAFRRKYLREMSAPDASRTIDMLAALSLHCNFAVGCYCQDESRCHRSLLRELLLKRGAAIAEQ